MTMSRCTLIAIGFAVELMFAVGIGMHTQHAVAAPRGILAEAIAGTDDNPKSAPEQSDQELVAALKNADLIFTAKTAKVKPEGQTRSIPPSVFGQVTFQDVNALQGTAPADPSFRYSFREGQTKNLDLTPNAKVLVATKANAVVVIVPASEANLTLAKKAIAAGEKK